MKRAIGILVLIAVVVAGWLLVRGLGRLAEQPVEPETVLRLESEGAWRAVRLYFADHQRPGWVTEDRVVADVEIPEALAEAIITEIIARRPEPFTGLSTRAKILSFYITEDGVGWCDFSSELLVNWPDGDGREWASLGSLVLSLTENIPVLRAVQIIVEGRIVSVPSGSMPIDRPLEPGWFQLAEVGR
jgi:hypothetical protein